MAGRDRTPDFIVLGSMKCGTTSLHHYLSLHPEVHVSWPKELNFFVGGERRADNDPPWGNWWRGVEWYRRHFTTDRRACGEVSPGYVGARWGPLVMERMRSVVPAARLILLVREPLERLQSSYLMDRRGPKLAPITFTEFVMDGRHAEDIAYSCYGTQIERVLRCFPLESLLVIESAQLDRDRDRALERIFSFIGVDPAFRSPGFSRRLYDRRRAVYPGALGKRILRSLPLRWSEQWLPFTLHEAVKGVVLRPLAIAEPDLSLPLEVEKHLRARFRDEVALARQLTGLPLRSLGA